MQVAKKALQKLRFTCSQLQAKLDVVEAESKVEEEDEGVDKIGEVGEEGSDEEEESGE